MNRALAALAAPIAAVGLLAACGDTSGPDEPVAASSTSSTSDTTEIAEGPARIVSLSPSITETLFAIGAGDQVVAVDSMSNHPADAPVTDLSAYEPNVEAIAAYDPDLVVVDASVPDVIAGLELLDIEVFEADAAQTLEDAYAQVRELGEVTGHADEADAVADKMQADIEAALARLPEREEPLSFYHELDDMLYSVTSKTFIGELYSSAGLVNVADAADPDGSNGGYPQLSAELLVAADPDLIFLADVKCCGQSAATLAARPGFAGLSAVVNGNVVLLDDDTSSRWGPRVVEFLEQIVDAVAGFDEAEVKAAA